MKVPVWLSIDAVLAFHGQLVAEHGGSPQVRDRGLLESALAGRKNHYAYGERDILVLATVYANGITRNHPFIDGNKRAAFMAAYTFLGVNGFELIAPEHEAVEFVLGLSAHDISEEQFTDWLRRSCKKPRARKTIGSKKRPSTKLRKKKS